MKNFKKLAIFLLIPLYFIIPNQAKADTCYREECSTQIVGYAEHKVCRTWSTRTYCERYATHYYQSCTTICTLRILGICVRKEQECVTKSYTYCASYKTEEYCSSWYYYDTPIYRRVCEDVPYYCFVCATDGCGGWREGNGSCSSNDSRITCHPCGTTIEGHYCPQGACCAGCASGWTSSRPTSGTYLSASGRCQCCNNSMSCYKVTCTPSWSPSPSTVCSGQTFTQTDGCGSTRTSTGTKQCCTDTSWSPDPSTVPYGETFTQTSNCGNTRQAVGTSRGPSAAIGCNPSSCSVYQNHSLNLLNQSTDPDNDISSSNWIIRTSGGVDKANVTYSGSNTMNNYAVTSVLGIGSFGATLTVEDVSGMTDIAIRTFVIKKGVTADFDCSLDNENFEECGELSVSTGEIVYLKDKSDPCEDGTIISRTWEVTGNDTLTGNEVNPSFTLIEEETNVELTVVCEGIGDSTSDNVNMIINSDLSFPIWEEISPN